MNINWTDLIRMTIIGQGIATTLLVGLILYRYGQLIVKSTFRVRERSVPWHFITLSMSYILATIYICSNLLDRLGQPFSWRIPVGWAVFMMGDIGLILFASIIKDELKYIRKF